MFHSPLSRMLQAMAVLCIFLHRSLAFDAEGTLAMLAGAQSTPASFFDSHASLDAVAKKVSPACARGVHELKTCHFGKVAGFACSSRDFLLDPRAAEFLGCNGGDMPVEERLNLCSKMCLSRVQEVLNTSVQGTCSIQAQAMLGFSAPLPVTMIGSLDAKNFSGPKILPMPNIGGDDGSISFFDLGNPEKCAQIPGAEYCVLTGSGQMTLSAEGGSPVGTEAKASFTYGACLPSSCTAQELKTIALGMGGRTAEALGLNVQCGFLEKVGEASGLSKKLEDTLGWGGVPVQYKHKQPITTGFVITLSFVGLFMILVGAGTFVDWRRESKQRALAPSTASSPSPESGMEAGQPLRPVRPEMPRMSPMETFLNHWSLLRNGRAFLRVRTENNTFACMDCMRTIAMMQVVLGHTFNYSTRSSGMSNMEQFLPPNGLFAQTWFMFLPGCTFSVDTFFLFSGFLCCHTLQKKVFNKDQFKTFKGLLSFYPKFILQRVLRLLPLEMLCIALCLNVLPQAGVGVLWNLEQDGGHCYDRASHPIGGPGCREYWWANLLFIQNFDAFLSKCFGHTWYLGVDMQLYLAAPIFCFMYAIDRKAGWALLSIGLCVGMFLPMILSLQYNIMPDVSGAFGGPDYFKMIYTKPWCRCTPFLVGIAAAWLWQEKLHQFSSRPVTVKGHATSLTMSCLGLGLTTFSMFGRVVFYQCDFMAGECQTLDAHPAGKVMLLLWTAFGILGWSVGLSIVMILCFQNRFLPVAQNFMHLSLWQPFAKLSYACYLCHTTIMMMQYCQQTGPMHYTGATMFFYVVGFLSMAMICGLCLHLLLEKPLANVQMKVFGGGGD